MDAPPEKEQARLGEASPERSDSRLNQMQVQLDTLRQQLEAQRLEMARLARNAKAADRPAAGAAEAATSDEASQVSEHEQELAEQGRHAARLLELQTQFASQGKDAGWSRTAESQIAASAKQVADASGAAGSERSELRDADCRTALCRLTLTHKDAASAESFIQEFANNLGWRQTHGRVQSVQNPDGSIEAVIYLSREGRRLYETGEQGSSQ
ncbi:MAG: hypothetical protein H7X91_04360 [Burkholderiales bacterium]|nr:hypothetical protein [Burkholderiales bacterium]